MALLSESGRPAILRNCDLEALDMSRLDLT